MDDTQEPISVEVFFNINAPARVQLTAAGRKTLAKHVEEVAELVREPYASQIREKYIPDESGFFEVRLWQLMKIFGSSVTLVSDSPFVDNRIEIRDRLREFADLSDQGASASASGEFLTIKARDAQ